MIAAPASAAAIPSAIMSWIVIGIPGCNARPQGPLMAASSHVLDAVISRPQYLLLRLTFHAGPRPCRANAAHRAAYNLCGPSAPPPWPADNDLAMRRRMRSAPLKFCVGRETGQLP